MPRTDQDQIEEIERRLDASWQSTTPPARTWDECVYYLVAVAEDQPRLAALRTPELGIAALQRASEVLHSSTFSLRQALLLVHRRLDGIKESPLATIDSNNATLGLPDLPGLPAVISEDGYSLARTMLDEADRYELCRAAFSELRSNLANADYNPKSQVITFTRDASRVPYEAHAMLSNAHSTSPNLGALLMNIVGRALNLSHTAQEIVDRTRIHEKYAGRINYSFSSSLCMRLYKELPVEAWSLPLEWSFPWASGYDHAVVCRALSVRAFYHVLSVHFGALQNRADGLGVDSLPLVISRKQLTTELSSISGVGEDTVRRVLLHLEFGHLTDTPDQALQPLIPLSAKMLCVPAIHVCSLKMQRNSLALHARVAKSSFDGQSSAFETGMIANALQRIKRHKPMVRQRIKASLRRIEEIDLLIADFGKSEIMIIEMQWTLEPADPREVIQREKSCAGKVGQIVRKTEFLRENRAELNRRYRVALDEATRFFSVLAIDGYPGVGHGNLDGVAVVPFSVLLNALDSSESVAEAYRKMIDLDWLPTEGQDYYYVRDTAVIDGITLQWFGLSLVRSGIPHSNQERDSAPIAPSLNGLLSDFLDYVDDRNSIFPGYERIFYIFREDELRIAVSSLKSTSLSQAKTLAALMKRLTAANLSLLICRLTIQACVASNVEADLASAILSKMNSDEESRVTIRKPRVYYKVLDTSVIIALAIDSRFWSFDW